MYIRQCFNFVMDKMRQPAHLVFWEHCLCTLRQTALFGVPQLLLRRLFWLILLPLPSYFELRSYCPDIYTVPCGTTIFLLMFELTVNLIIIGIINTLTIVFNNKVWPKFWQKANQNPAMHIIEVEIKVAFLGTEDS